MPPARFTGSPYLSVEIQIENLGAGVQGGFEDLDRAPAQQFDEFRIRVPEIPEDAHILGTYLDTGGPQPARDPVVAERALVGHPQIGMEIASSVGASLDAVAAPD